MSVKSFSVQEFQDMCEEDMGYCIFCHEFTNSGVEPDAENYTCESCNNETVFGAEQALIMGLLTVAGED
jgi:hypothetical protein